MGTLYYFLKLHVYLQLSWKFDLKKDNKNQFWLEKTPIVFSYLKEMYLLNGNEI